jgi:thymidylate synthase (FAD)
MKLIRPSIEFLDINTLSLKLVEKAGRTCYKSEDKITESSYLDFAQKMKQSGHHAMLEFGWCCYRVICDRGVSHEIVRHRLFSYAQESTRYCNYKGGIEYIIPPWLDLLPNEYLVSDDFGMVPVELHCWLSGLFANEQRYKMLLTQYGWKPQQARSILPNALKTEIVIAGNFREWLHFFKLRTSTKAHPQMKEVADMVLDDIRTRVPVIFEEV